MTADEKRDLERRALSGDEGAAIALLQEMIDRDDLDPFLLERLGRALAKARQGAELDLGEIAMGRLPVRVRNAIRRMFGRRRPITWGMAASFCELCWFARKNFGPVSMRELEHELLRRGLALPSVTDCIEWHRAGPWHGTGLPRPAWSILDSAGRRLGSVHAKTEEDAALLASLRFGFGFSVRREPT